MIQRYNRLASKSERLKASNHLPQGLINYFEQQAHLTTLFQQVVIDKVSPEMASLCQVVRYANGELIVSSANATAINHLYRLLPALMDTLKTHQDFQLLHKIHLVHYVPTPLKQPKP